MMEKFSLAYDKNYGIDNRTGWTTCIDGIVAVELNKGLLRTLLKTLLWGISKEKE